MRHWSPLWGSLSLGSLQHAGGNAAYGAGCLDLDQGRKFKAGKGTHQQGAMVKLWVPVILSAENLPPKKKKKQKGKMWGLLSSRERKGGE